MPEYFFTYIDGIPEQMKNKLFSMQHLLALAIVFSAWVVVIIILKDRSPESKWKAVSCMCFLLPLLEIAQMLWYKSVGEFSPGYTLPLHLCSLMSVILPVMAITRNRLLQEYSFAIGLTPALMTLITPDVYYYPSLSFIYIQTMLVHGIICLIPLYMVFCLGFRPDIRRLPKVIALLVGLAVIMIPINKLTGGNYFFLNYPAAGSPMETFAKVVGRPWYLVPTFMLGCVLWSVSYLPFAGMKYSLQRKCARRVHPGKALRVRASEAETKEPALQR